jgi:hypothetical protein
MFGGIFVGFLVIGIAFAVYGFFNTRRRWDHSLAGAHSLLASPELAGRGVVKGKAADRDVTIELTTRGDGSSSESWTEIRAELRDVEMRLDLRPETPLESAVVLLSRAVDVKIGDRAMDAEFVIDGAPADAVRRVLDDATLRKQLLSLCPLELEQKGATLQIAKRGWLAPPALDTMLLSLVTLATRMEAVSGTRSREANAELEALAHARARRLSVRRTLLIALVVLFIGSCVLLTQLR